MGTKFRALLVTGALLFTGGVATTAMATAAHAATCTTSWKHATSGDWSAAANWTNGVPDSTTDACVTVAGTYTVTVHDETVEAQSLHLGGTAIVSIQSDCTQPAELTLDADSTIDAGSSLSLSSPGCTQASFFQSSGTLTNAGDIAPNGQSVSGVVDNTGTISVTEDGTESFARWTNEGTIYVAPFVTLELEQQSAFVNDGLIEARHNGALMIDDLVTFELDGGRLSGPNPVVMNGGWFQNSNPDAPGTIVVGGMTMTGDLGPHQTLRLPGNCSNGGTAIMRQDFPTQWTNRGTIEITAQGNCSIETSISGDSTFTNDGTITTEGLVTWDGAIVNHGTISAEGDFEVGSLTNAHNGTLAVTLASRRDYGHFHVIGIGDPLTLHGTLAVQTARRYWPDAGQHFDLFDYGTRSGRFDTITGTTKAGHTVVLRPLYRENGMNLKAE